MYATNLSTIYLYIASGLLFWTFLSGLAQKRRKLKNAWKSVNFIGVLIAFYGILSYTVLHRVPSDNHIFTFFADYSNEFYREMLMNAFLYYPFGLTLSTLIGPVSILVGFVVSLAIESWQYFAGTGVAQGTDVVMNTLGVVIGCIPWFLVRSGLVEKVVSLLKRIDVWMKELL